MRVEKSNVFLSSRRTGREPRQVLWDNKALKEKEMTSVHDVADYIIVKLDEAKDGLNILKLQKLAYYTQAWRLALKNERLFDGRFQAWVHGPVSRQLYDRFSTTHMMYDLLGPSDIRSTFNLEAMPKDVREHIDEVLEAYARFSGPQLEDMTHDEAPWIQARGDRKPSERCETEIDEALMGSFYRKLLEEADA
ncbi:MAG: type II toxin-antitoxin system antitoxin SocA domain-containing protein [Azovibrio sp.]|uniref:Panacea domain-containing protein n=1 Tax=Azovibrio sp. TaxID=1872673 RepID=UPI003C72C2DF